MKTFTHNELCKIAVKWCQRTTANGGHGCKIAVSEIGYSEIADAIGFLSYTSPRYPNVESVLIEAKTSRSDFLRDASKPHRQIGAKALGDVRYYICPEGLIKPEELPEKWGLIYVNSRGHVKVVAGLASSYKNKFNADDVLKWKHDNVDKQYERNIIFDIICRVNARSIESRHDGWRQTYRDNKKLKKDMNVLIREKKSRNNVSATDKVKNLKNLKP